MSEIRGDRVNGKVIGLMILIYGQKEFKISVDIILLLMMESFGWISTISVMNLMRFIYVGTILIPKHGKIFLLKEAGKVLMQRVFQMHRIEMLKWKRIRNMVLQLTTLEKVLWFSDWRKRKMPTPPTNMVIWMSKLITMETLSDNLKKTRQLSPKVQLTILSNLVKLNSKIIWIILTLSQ